MTIRCEYCAYVVENALPNPFCDAARRNDLAEISRLLDAYCEDHLETALNLAAAGEHVQAMILLHERWPPSASLGNAFVHAAVHGSLAAMGLICTWFDDVWPGLPIDDAAREAVGVGPHNLIYVIRLLVSWVAEEQVETFCNRLLIELAKARRPDIARFLAEKYGASPREANASLALDVQAGIEDPNDVTMIIIAETLDRWEGRTLRERHHRQLTAMTFTLAPLGLPTYVLLWLLEWAVPPTQYRQEPCLNELHRVRLIERMQTKWRNRWFR